MSSAKLVLKVEKREIPISNPDKILFPDREITKRELVDYYQRIAPWMLPHLRGRPLSLHSFPNGIEQPGFFEKNAGRGTPEWVRTAELKKHGGSVAHIVCDNAATLVYLANLACITPHVWLSRSDKIDVPDQMAFDLDPSGDDFGMVKSAARALKRILDELGLPAYLKSTGSRGLHVIVPLS